MDRKNTRLTIVGFKGKTGRVSPIKEIRVTSEGEFALEYVPMITTTGKVKIERDVRPSQPK